MHGVGTFYWADGRTFTGNYIDGKKNGFGTFICPKKNITYTGNWRNGVQDGKGKLRVEGFTSRHGEWSEGQVKEWHEGPLPLKKEPTQ